MMTRHLDSFLGLGSLPKFSAVALCWLAVAGVACGKDTPLPAPAPTRLAAMVRPAPFSTTTASPVASVAPVDTPLDYPNEGLGTVAATCLDPKATLLMYPLGDRSPLTWLLQALVAHPELEVTSEKPSAPMQVRLEVAGYGTKFFKPNDRQRNYEAIVGQCFDGATCLKLAAMVRAIVRESSPKLVCGDPPGVSGQLQPISSPARGATLPGSEDGIAQCARLTVCLVRHGHGIRDPEDGCVASGVRFRSACALRASCAEVAQCALAHD